MQYYEKLLSVARLFLIILLSNSPETKAEHCCFAAVRQFQRNWCRLLFFKSKFVLQPEQSLTTEIPYQMICMSTDYDCWKETEEAVSVEQGNLN